MSMRQIYEQLVFNSVAIGKNAVATSAPISLNDLTGNGVFSLFLTEQAGALSQVTYTYSLCDTIDGTYITPSSAVAIATAFVGGSTDIFSFEPELAKFMKIIATELDVAAVTALTAKVLMQ